RAGRLDVLADAVRDAAAGQGCDPAEQDDLAERFHDEAWDWIERPDFLTEDLDTQIRRARTLMDLHDEDSEGGPGNDPQDDPEGDGDLIEGEAREVSRPEPQPPQAPEHPPQSVHGCTPIPTDGADAPIRVSPCASVDRAKHEPASPPSPDPFAHWPRRIVPDHPFNSS
ncbi:hypothetical protein, partial [Phenylobacterium sp.]|uniref:hypothetical protein n=1 Tax=Phenylobacterium sp. TaxID=1871053 RepID=UPI00301D1B20